MLRFNNKGKKKMNSLIKKITIPSLLLTGLALSPLALAQGSFDGKDVNVKFEIWNSDNVTEVQVVRNEQDVIASDMSNPDIYNFHGVKEDTQLWDIGFHKREIKMVFTSIYRQDMAHQYMHRDPVGFHFEDTADNMSDILHVSVDDQFAPSSFNKDLVRFDANNIHVSLQGSMCHLAGMGSMPMCDNEHSPTGYSNTIKVKVIFAETVDGLYGWAESEFSDLFPASGESFYLIGYYVREYPNYFLGVKDGNVLLYDKNSGELIDAGAIEYWLDQMPMDMHDHDMDHDASVDCAEDQHMMPDGMCMDNDAMHEHDTGTECAEGQHMMPDGMCMSNDAMMSM